MLFIIAAFAATEVSAQLTVTLSPSDFNGYNISCFGKKDGAIDATVSGGTPPYTFSWSNQSTDEDQSELASGFYRVEVTDALNELADAEITLTEPVALRLSAVPFTYPNGLNLSCHDCYNGSIDVTVSDGVPPYAYEWGDEVYTQDRNGLGALAYQVTVADANGCQVNSERITLTQPERSDWRMDGNANTSPATHYIGTTDAQPLIFKTNGLERLRLLDDGQMRSEAWIGTNIGLLVADEAGTLKRYSDDLFPELLDGCPAHERLPWLRCGNSIDANEYLGTNNNRPLVLKTNAEFRMMITAQGRVGIGQLSPAQQFEVTHSDASGGMVLRNGLSGNAHSEIRFYQGATQRWGLGCDLNSDGGQDFFLWDHQASAIRLLVNSQGRVGIGTEPPTGTSAYRLFVADGMVTRDVRVTQATNWPDYVFDASHHLMPLSELRTFLKRERHMPGMPSAAELEKDGGFEVGEMQARLLKLVEEQALYILQLEARLTAVEQKHEAAKP